MEKIDFEIEGIAPLLMDQWIDEAQPKNEEGYKKQAELKAYRDEKGFLCIPSTVLKACIREAAGEVGKKMETKKNKQTIRSAIFLEPNNLLINNKQNKHDGIVRHIVTRKQSTQATRIATYRPIINKWKIQGTINSFGVPKDFIKECIELGGFRYGLCGFRPEFGRFKLNKFEVVKK